MRTTLPTMGTVASLELEEEFRPLLLPIRDVLDRWESIFSLYRSDTELSQVAAGRLALAETSPIVREVYATALEWSARTDGAFTPHRPDGVLDLNGIVKALAISDVGVILERAGRWSVNVGGDILTSARALDDPERIGVADPFDRGALLATVSLTGSRRALATSGSAERGDHIWRGGASTAIEFVQATVIADDIVTADVLATAIIAGGAEQLDRITERFDVDVLTVDRAGDLRATPGLRRALRTR